jgi:peptide/nickel transport system ATP-binding protein
LDAPSAPPPRGDLLVVRGLTVRFYTYDGVLKALDGVNYSIAEREIFGIVGETGCGKSVAAKAILRLIPDPPGRITAGEVLFRGLNLLDSIEDEARIRVDDLGRAKVRRNRRIAKRMEALMRTIRGRYISMIFQEASAALNPTMTVRAQIAEAFLIHQLGEMCDAVEKARPLSGLQKRFFNLMRRRETVRAEFEGNFRELSTAHAALKAAKEGKDLAAVQALDAQVSGLEHQALRLTIRLAWADRRVRFIQWLPVAGKRYFMGALKGEVDRRVVEMLKQVNIADPERKADAYPFELSGGMQQRVMIAMALSCRPTLLLADEPTTALDVTIQAQILTLIRELRDKFGSSIMLITHDLGVVAETCDRVGVMYAGVMAEIGGTSALFRSPKHPYTVGLLRSIPETLARTGTLSIIPGNVPSLLKPPEGCRFHPRCPFASAKCQAVVPALFEVEPGRLVSCHLYDHPEFFPKETLEVRDAGLNRGWQEVPAR